MAGPGFMKRQKEIKRQERSQDKAARKAERQKEKGSRVVVDGEDPDIAHIIPGPQPREDEDEAAGLGV